MNIRPKFKLWLEADGKPVIGQGKADLLLEIYETGSLTAAAKNLGISYRHAHDMLGQLNEICGTDIIITEVGGSAGGGTRLTEEGRELVEKYIRLKRDMGEWLEGQSDPIFK